MRRSLIFGVPSVRVPCDLHSNWVGLNVATTVPSVLSKKNTIIEVKYRAVQKPDEKCQIKLPHASPTMHAFGPAAFSSSWHSTCGVQRVKWGFSLFSSLSSLFLKLMLCCLLITPRVSIKNIG